MPKEPPPLGGNPNPKLWFTDDCPFWVLVMFVIGIIVTAGVVVGMFISLSKAVSKCT